jgi:hypothetical protein
MQMRRYFIHPGPALEDKDWNGSGAELVHTGDSYVIYDWSHLSEKPGIIARSTCWSPALQAGVQLGSH